MKKLIFSILGVLIFCGLFSQEIPQKISYQGKLLENGNPVTGTKSITFTIDTWSETKNVQVTNGLYSVTLGETTPIPTSIFDNSSSVNLQINVAGTDLLPQTEILSVPYTYKAEKAVDAEKIAGRTVSTTLPSTDQVLKWDGSQWVPQTDSIGGLTLPYSGTYSGSSYAFDITSSGTSDLARFEIDNPLVGGKVLSLRSHGGGSLYIRHYDDAAGNAIEVLNSNNIEAVKIRQNSAAGRALFVSTNADNDCADFRVTEFSNGDAIYASTSTTSGTGYAGNFNGNVQVVDNLSKGGGSFKIDHPLDPENKYLYHSFVESPDMLNVYNGNIILNNSGEATVELPEWFETLNKDFRYQLTCIGGYAPVYIAEKISDNHFKIAGGSQGMEVSWQVTGIRQDPYANQNRIQVEVEKTEKEKGHYQHYKAYNQPIEKSISAVKHPEILEKTNKK